MTFSCRDRKVLVGWRMVYKKGIFITVKNLIACQSKRRFNHIKELCRFVIRYNFKFIYTIRNPDPDPLSQRQKTVRTPFLYCCRRRKSLSLSGIIEL